MKSRLISTAILSLFLFSFSSFAQTTVTRSLSSFDKIAVSGGYDKVILKEGSTESVTLEVSGIDPDNIKTEVRGSTLEIGMKKGNWSNFKAKITVTYKSIRELASSGSSDIVAESVIKGDEFDLATSGSGDFTGTFDVRELEVAISGSSDMTLKGRADEQEIAISGSGDINASELKGKEAEVAISGSSDMTLKGRADEQEIAISGSGDVNASDLKGKQAEVAISGSGDVKLSVSGPVKTAVSGSGSVTNNN